jgi:hypothetical protein
VFFQRGLLLLSLAADAVFTSNALWAGGQVMEHHGIGLLSVFRGPVKASFVC